MQPTNPAQNQTSNPLAGGVNPQPVSPQPVSPVPQGQVVRPATTASMPNIQTAAPVISTSSATMPNLQTAQAPAQPVTPVQPVASVQANSVVNPALNSSAFVQNAPVNPVFQPSNVGGMDPTAPLTQPEPVPEPDPVEVELKAPMKATEPVPGSIGSAVSGPEVKDDAVDTTNNVENMGKTVKPAKKQANKTTLILIAAIGGVVVIALAVYLLMQLGILPALF